MKQLNFQNELHFDFLITKLSNIQFFVQSVSLPGIATTYVQQPNQFTTIKNTGDKLDFQDLTITLKLDEGMEGWFEIYKWVTGITRPVSFAEFRDLVANSTSNMDGSKPLFRNRDLRDLNKGYANLKSDASLIINDSNHIPYLEISFIDIHPIALSGLAFRTDQSGVGFMTYDVVFAYNYFLPKPGLRPAE